MTFITKQKKSIPPPSREMPMETHPGTYPSLFILIFFQKKNKKNREKKYPPPFFFVLFFIFFLIWCCCDCCFKPNPSRATPYLSFLLGCRHNSKIDAKKKEKQRKKKEEREDKKRKKKKNHPILNPSPINTQSQQITNL